MSDQKCKAVILAGGQGTRFWPISRIRRPKQFLSISSSGENLIQATARRVSALCGEENVWIITNVLHKELIRKYVPYARLFCEPAGRNTAASIGLGALYLMREDPQAVMLVLPADHAVSDDNSLRTNLEKAVKLAASQDLLVTLGIVPTYPHTGYGYIKRGEKLADHSYKVARFYEKPNLERATKYCDSGDFFWNSGMFAWRASVIMEAFKEHLPAMHGELMKIGAAIGTPDEEKVINEVFPALESTSIDFGILEHARNCAVVSTTPFGWNDVGSWDAWAEHFEKDPEGNLLHGNAMVIDSKNCVVHSENKTTVVLGAKNMVVIDSGDALLVCPRESVQDVRKVVEQLKKTGRNDLI